MRQVTIKLGSRGGPDELVASHMPVELDPEPAPYGAICYQFALPNPQGRATPSWYPTKRRTGRTVPTLRYIAVHAYETVYAFLDGDELNVHLTALTGRFESSNDSPWKIDDAPAD